MGKPAGQSTLMVSSANFLANEMLEEMMEVAPIPGELQKVLVGSVSTRHDVMSPTVHTNASLPPGWGMGDTLPNVASILTSQSDLDSNTIPVEQVARWKQHFNSLHFQNSLGWVMWLIGLVKWVVLMTSIDSYIWSFWTPRPRRISALRPNILFSPTLFHVIVNQTKESKWDGNHDLTVNEASNGKQASDSKETVAFVYSSPALNHDIDGEASLGITSNIHKLIEGKVDISTKTSTMPSHSNPRMLIILSLLLKRLVQILTLWMLIGMQNGLESGAALIQSQCDGWSCFKFL